MKDKLSDLSERRRESTYPVTKGQARDFMRKLIAEEFIWKKLYENGNWGGHLHRAILNIAVMDGPDEDEVDIVPLYVEEYVKQPPYDQEGIAEDTLRSFAHSYVGNRVDAVRDEYQRLIEYDPNYMTRRNHAIEDFEATFGYFGTRTELSPDIMLAFDALTNKRIQEKYFYPHNALTGERYDSPSYPQDMHQPIPAPEPS